MKLRAPFPWFGGKSRVAHEVWPRFGQVANYVEPFAGSLAVLLNRPADNPPRVETVNDIDAYLANFWRAVTTDPDAVARHCDWPVNEADLHARHRWLVETAPTRIEQLKRDPDFFDAKVAGWWVWGQCLWIGSGWCAKPEWTGRAPSGAFQPRNGDTSEQARRPHLTGEQGVVGVAGWGKRPVLHAKGQRGVIERPDGPAGKRPYLGGNGGGVGVHSTRKVGRRPNMGGAGGGQGVQAPRLTREQIPRISAEGGSISGVHSEGVQSIGLFEYMRELQARLRRVRVCCGDWSRIVTPAVTTYIGVTGVFLDPPYSHAERAICYSHDNDVSAAVREWAIEHGRNTKLRIALCGYEGEHDMPSEWECVAWKAGGGYGRSERGRANRHRERVWFSPSCLRMERPALFAVAESDEMEVSA